MVCHGVVLELREVVSQTTAQAAAAWTHPAHSARLSNENSQ